MEKKGLTVQLVYDFNTAANLEVFFPNTKYGWFRVTSVNFRSFNGKRRINGKPYEGPVYLYQTNKRVDTSKYELDKYAGYKYNSELTLSEKMAL